MRHCIFNYIDHMRRGTYFAFSITDPKNPRNCCTIAFSIQDKTRNDKDIYGTTVLSTNYNDQIKHSFDVGSVINSIRKNKNAIDDEIDGWLVEADLKRFAKIKDNEADVGN